jgi:hypothetical protein
VVSPLIGNAYPEAGVGAEVLGSRDVEKHIDGIIVAWAGNGKFSCTRCRCAKYHYWHQTTEVSSVCDSCRRRLRPDGRLARVADDELHGPLESNDRWPAGYSTSDGPIIGVNDGQ